MKFVTEGSFCARFGQIIFNQGFMSYLNASSFCQKINGDFFFPRNVTSLQNLATNISQSILKGFCKSTFWVPFVRSKVNKTNWVFDSESGPEIEVSFRPWTKRETVMSGKQGNCMYFNIVDKEYVEAPCQNKICSFCQIDEWRQSFTLKSSCPFYETFLDEKYFLVQDIENFNFFGLKGQSNIIWIKDQMVDSWSIESLANFPRTEMMTSGSNFPLGISEWESKLDCQGNELKNESRILFKLTNVSTIDNVGSNRDKKN